MAKLSKTLLPNTSILFHRTTHYILLHIWIFRENPNNYFLTSTHQNLSMIEFFEEFRQIESIQQY